MLKDVLYIDDSSLDLFILNQIQRKYHCFNSLTMTEDAVSALVNLKLNALNSDALPDIILLDLYMPYFDGYQFLDQFEKLYPLLKKQIHVHVLTSSMSPRDVKRCKGYPHVSGYHVKPFTFDVISNQTDLH